ncbi:hypothetical protein HHI36_022085 [Cryptolaemus montrouzieri]|uniref:Battenin n=1 Tax=Cryptolaemus montrouzieri TaxID=559131 RepID=A0ABD2MZI2_9CUCU
MFKHGDDDVPDYVKDKPTDEEIAVEHKNLKIRYYRSVISFWILGVCNNFGYVAMLTGAENIIQENTEKKNDTLITSRECTIQSTGIVLLSQLIPATLITFIVPFIPMLVHCRMVSCLAITIIGFLLVGFTKNSLSIALLGVALVSISCSVGEMTLLQYSAYFSRNTLSTWSSGTGGAGVIGALSYTLGVEKGYRDTMLGMIAIPIIMGVAFWVILPIPTEKDKQSVLVQHNWNKNEVTAPCDTLKKKSHLIPKVSYKYIIPLGLVYLFEYFINQGMYELVKVDSNIVSRNMQYQWLQVAYQVGVFISRSSVNFLYIKYIWALSVLQFINVVIFTTTAIYWYIWNFWILFVMGLEEGLIGGAAYVNTYVRIGREEEEEDKQFMNSFTCVGNGVGIMSAGFLAILAHNLICKLPPPA